MAPLVVLVGAPGSGKSSVGKALARSLGVPLRDTDSDIVDQQGRPISDIFTSDGEDHFRELEKAAVAAALTEHDGVLALGGGAILAQDTRELLRGHRVVFLAVSMPNGVKRTGMASNRPLLVGVNPRATFKALLDARLPLYREVSMLEVNTDELDVRAVAAEIVDRLGLA